MHRSIRIRQLQALGLAVLGAALSGGGSLVAQQQVPPPRLAGAANQNLGAVTVPIGGSQRLQMSSKKLIRTVINERENVARVTPVVTDPTAVLITGLQSGITRITLTDIDNLTQTFEVIVQLDVELLKSLLKRSVPTANIDIIPGLNNVLILTGNVARADDIDVILRVAQSVVGGGPGQIINAMVVGGVQQVQIDVVVAGVNRTELRRQGLNWFLGQASVQVVNQTGGINSVQNFISTTGVVPDVGNSVGPGFVAATPSAVSNLVFGLVSPRFQGFLQALREERLAKLLAEPKLVTLSGRPATFNSGGQQAVPQVTAAGVGGGTVGTTFVEFGTQLNCLPIVLGNGKIYLEVEPIITQLNAANGFAIGGTIVAGRDIQTVRTSVMMEDGQTFAIGGLIQNSVQAIADKVPVLGEIPFLAPFLNQVSFTESEQELVILVTPHLVDPMDCNQVPRRLPGRETRSPDDFELFVEYLLEAPRGQRRAFQGKHYVAAWKNDPTAHIYPCPDGNCGNGSSAYAPYGGPSGAVTAGAIPVAGPGMIGTPAPGRWPGPQGVPVGDGSIGQAPIPGTTVTAEPAVGTPGVTTSLPISLPQ